MALPFLPGNSFNRNLGKEEYHKSHYHEKYNGIPYQYNNDRPGIGREKLPGQRIEAPVSVFPSSVGPAQPAWLAFDKQTLSFDAYFQESVNERREEQYRIRRCKILFYPEDDTIQVIEPRMPNTGMPQGTIIRRHRIAKPPPNDHLYYTVDDFNVGQDFTAYGKKFRIVACDQFTANFLRKLGVRLGDPEPIPNDPYLIHRKAFSESQQPLRPYERIDHLRQFLDHDKHVLRFFCFWDDTDSLYGDPREMVLNYFLADDTIEIREVIPANSGRDAVPCFLHRQKLPRSVEPVPLPGTVTERTLLNVFGHPQRGGRYILDSLKLGKTVDDFYTDRDLTLGASINVYGRKFLICDCDEFTKEYYRTKYGIRDFTPVKPKLPESRITVTHQIPPYNGWGSEEDSLANCKGIIPVPPRGQFTKFMTNDRCGFDSNILRFMAQMVSDNALDHERQFIISCYLLDDTFQIFEMAGRNSGFRGGVFLERSKVKKPGYKLFDVNPPEYYKPCDIYVGAELNFNSFIFRILDADEYTYNYMENHSAEFPHADLRLVMEKLKPYVEGRCEDMNQFALNQDPEQTGTFGFNQLKCLLDQLTGPENKLSPHEVATVARNYALKRPKQIRCEIMLGIVQQTLRKYGFEDYQGLLLACQQQDSEKTGEIKREDLRRICMAIRLPLPEDLLNAVMDYSANQNGLIRYPLFVDQLNWRCQPTGTTAEVPCDYTGNLEVDWLSTSIGDSPKSLGAKQVPIEQKVTRIRYKALFDDLCGIPSGCS